MPSVLFERDQTALAKGLAFGTRHPEHLLNVRASNTEPLLRLNLEATTAAKMEQKRDEVLALIRS